MNEKQMVNEALRLVGDCFARTPPADRQEMLSQIATTAIVLLQGTYGSQWVRDYLNGALADLDDPNVIRVGISAATPQ